MPITVLPHLENPKKICRKTPFVKYLLKSFLNDSKVLGISTNMYQPLRKFWVYLTHYSKIGYVKHYSSLSFIDSTQAGRI